MFAKLILHLISEFVNTSHHVLTCQKNLDLYLKKKKTITDITEIHHHFSYIQFVLALFFSLHCFFMSFIALFAFIASTSALRSICAIYEDCRESDQMNWSSTGNLQTFFFSTKRVSGWMFRIAWLQFSCLLVTLWYDGNKGNVGISISGQQRQGSTCADWQGNKWAERRPMPSAWKRLLHIIKEAMRRFWSSLFFKKSPTFGGSLFVGALFSSYSD